MVIASQETETNNFPVRSQRSVVALIDIGRSKESLLIPVEITAESSVSGTLMDVNVITSAYPRKVSGLISRALADEKAGITGIYYINKKAAGNGAFRGAIPTAASKSTAYGYVIHQISEKVNQKIENQTQTLQFARWFGDWQNKPENSSKVVNADGTPKVLYHQTSGDFYTFDPKHPGAGQFDSETPEGIFMKPTAADIGLAGERQIPLYANIRVPLVVDNRSALTAWYRSHIPGYAQAENNIREVDKRYAPQLEAAEEEEDRWYEEHYDEIRSGKISQAETEESDRILSAWEKASNDAHRQAKDLLTKYFNASKYDGIIIRQDEGSFGRSVESYIAFKPEQVKSAVENIGTFDRNNPDIRFSRYNRDLLRQESLKEENRAQQKEITALRQENERLRGLTGLTYKKSKNTASLGIAWGSQHDEVRLLDKGDTPEIQKARQLAKSHGLRLVLFGQGDLTIRGKKARAYLTGDRVFLRTDDPEFTVEQLMRSALAQNTTGRLLFVTAANGQSGWVPLDRIRTSIELKSLEPDISGHRSTESETTHREMAAERQELLTGQNEADIMGSDEAAESLTEEERAAILDYKSATSYRINAYLNAQQELPLELKRTKELVQSALQKLPKYSGIVFRNLIFDDSGGEAEYQNFLKRHILGEPVKYYGFSSSSKDPKGYVVKGKYVVHLIIKSMNGRDLRGFGNNFETEVLFQTDTFFKVNAFRNDNLGNPIIMLEEVNYRYG